MPPGPSASTPIGSKADVSTTAHDGTNTMPRMPSNWLNAHRPVEQAECAGRAARVAAHPGLHILHGVKDFVHHLLPGAELEAGVAEVLGVHDVLAQHTLHVVRGHAAILLHAMTRLLRATRSGVRLHSRWQGQPHTRRDAKIFYERVYSASRQSDRPWAQQQARESFLCTVGGWSAVWPPTHFRA